jgi:hypothetical protein
MDSDQIAAMERQMQEEHKKDMEALARLKRFLPGNGASSNGATSAATHQAASPTQPVFPLVPAEGTPLKHAIRDIMNHDPSVRWTNVKMLKYLQDIKFELNAIKPIYSIGGATQKLFDAGEIKIVKKGSGNTPHVFRGLTPLEQAARDAAAKEDDEV